MFKCRKDLTHKDLWQRAKRCLQKERTAVQRQDDDLLFPIGISLQHGRDGSGKLFTPDKIAHTIADSPPKPNSETYIQL